MPGDIAARDLFHGPGGADLAPTDGAAFTWVATDTTGTVPGSMFADADGRKWSAKLGPEAQTEVATSRIFGRSVITSLPPITFELAAVGRTGRRQPAARFRADFEGVEGHWRLVVVGKRLRRTRSRSAD